MTKLYGETIVTGAQFQADIRRHGNHCCFHGDRCHCRGSVADGDEAACTTWS